MDFDTCGFKDVKSDERGELSATPMETWVYFSTNDIYCFDKIFLKGLNKFCLDFWLKS